MNVIKRDGTIEEVKFDKVTERVSKLCDGLTHVKPVLIAQKVSIDMKDMITTQELDILASRVSADMGVYHPEYNLLAGRIAVSNLTKTINKTFSQAMDELYNFTLNGEHKPVIAKDVNDIIQTNAAMLNDAIVESRDMDYDIFAIETLKRSYLLRTEDGILETPQYLFMRVAIGVHKNDIPSALRMYELLSKRMYIHSTPTLFNSGTNRPQMASCFLLANMDDSIDGIFETVQKTALISKYAGGIGLHIHNIRSTNSYIEGTNGHSGGIVPFLRVFNETARAVNQAGKRKGGTYLSF